MHVPERIRERVKSAEIQRKIAVAAAIITRDINDHVRRPIIDALTLQIERQALVIFEDGSQLVVDGTRGAVTVLAANQTPSLKNIKRWDFKNVEPLLTNIDQDPEKKVLFWRAQRKQEKESRSLARQTATTAVPSILETKRYGWKAPEVKKVADTENILAELVDFLKNYLITRTQTAPVSFSEMVDPEGGWFNEYDPEEVAAALELLKETDPRLKKSPYLAKTKNASWRYATEDEV